MKVLLVADDESKYLWDFYQPGRLAGIDLMLSCGDLKQEYLEFLVTMGTSPLYYIHGNHDKGYEYYPPEGCECLEDRVVNINGLRVLGLGGCLRYNPGPYQYTEKEMAARVKRAQRKIRRAGGVDVIITHAPPRGYGDAEDNAHRGFACFLPLLEACRPQYLIHGHVHPSYGNSQPLQHRYGDTTILNAVGWHLLDITPSPAPEKKKRFLFW